jgi:hypothetical protein
MPAVARVSATVPLNRQERRIAREGFTGRLRPPVSFLLSLRYRCGAPGRAIEQAKPGGILAA